jgi:hypothetical protein
MDPDTLLAAAKELELMGYVKAAWALRQMAEKACKGEKEVVK